MVAEYWLQTNDPGAILVWKADHISQFWGLRAEWDDLADTAIFPAVTAKESLELLKQMIPDLCITAQVSRRLSLRAKQSPL